jgi:phenylacetic acid degradation operon negative regulatory protein
MTPERDNGDGSGAGPGDGPGGPGDPGGDLGLRALTARSIVASTLLGMRPPELSAQLLVRSGELFGVAEGTTRTALSRMLNAGELVADEGRYRLAGHLLERQARQEASRHPRLRARWDGGWRSAVVVAERRSASERTALRTAMTRARYGELREGVWLRPHNLVDGPPDVDGVTWFDARPDDPREVARRLWDLDAWADRADRLRGAMTPSVEESQLARAFELSAAVLRHLQSDPLLPDRLLPPRWPGDELREEYERFDASFKATWRTWFRRYRHG